MKYVWNTAGCCIIAMPLLLSFGSEESVAEGVSQRTKTYTTGRHYLMNGADAMERIMTSYKEVSGTVMILLNMYIRAYCIEPVCTYVHTYDQLCTCQGIYLEK